MVNKTDKPQILRLTPRPATATVYKTQDMASRGLYREVVVKLLQTGATRERQERFLRPAKIIVGLQHPNIIS